MSPISWKTTGVIDSHVIDINMNIIDIDTQISKLINYITLVENSHVGIREYLDTNSFSSSPPTGNTVIQMLCNHRQSLLLSMLLWNDSNRTWIWSLICLQMLTNLLVIMTSKDGQLSQHRGPFTYFHSLLLYYITSFWMCKKLPTKGPPFCKSWPL